MFLRYHPVAGVGIGGRCGAHPETDRRGRRVGASLPFSGGLASWTGRVRVAIDQHRHHG